MSGNSFGQAFQSAIFLARARDLPQAVHAEWAESMARREIFGSDPLTVYSGEHPVLLGERLLRTDRYREYRWVIEGGSTTEWSDTDTGTQQRLLV